MARRRRRGLDGQLITPPRPLDADWVREIEIRSPTGRVLTPGVEFKIRGERGRFRFVAHVLTDKGHDWVECVGGASGVVMSRAFAWDRITRVYRDRKIMSGQQAIQLMNAKRAQKREAVA